MYGILDDSQGSHQIWEGGEYRIKAHLSQQTIVHVLEVFLTPISDVTDRSEHWATDGSYVKVNCDAASFIIDVDWIV